MHNLSRMMGLGAVVLLTATGTCDKNNSGTDDLATPPADMAMVPQPDLRMGGLSLTAATPSLVANTGGTDVKLSGTEFETAAQVTIAGVAAQGVTFVSAGELSVKTPAKSGACGPVPVTVKNPGTGQTAMRSDLLSYSAQTVSFMLQTPNLSALTGADLQAVGAHDFSGDGKPDLVVAQGNNNLAMFKSNPTGFDAAMLVGATGTAPRSAAIGDIDGDGVPEFITANTASDNLSIMSGKAGTITNVPLDGDVLNNLKPRWVITADLNGDKLTDVVTSNESGSVTVLLNKGTQLDAPKTTLVNAAMELYAVAAGHIDGDAKLDLVVANGTITGGVVPLKGDGLGGFTVGTAVLTGKFPRSMVLADLTGDNILDVAVPHLQDSNVLILKGNGTGDFATHQTLTGVGTDPDAVAIGDFNCDGKNDLVVANRADGNPGTVGDGKVTVFINNGGAMLPTANPITVVTGEAQPRWIAVTDVDVDGRPDIVVINNRENSVSIILNKAT
jgi:hypothetical protein